MPTTYIFPQSYTLNTSIPYGFGDSYYGTTTIADVISQLALVTSGYNAIIITPQSQNHYQQVYPFTIESDPVYCCDSTWTAFTQAVNMLFAGYVGAPASQLYYRFNSNGSLSARMQSSSTSLTGPDSRTYGGYRGWGTNPCILILLNTTKQVFLNNVDITVPQYTWAPFQRLTGNDGQFQMDLSKISAAVIGDGETQTGDSDASHFTIVPRSSLYNMSVNMLDGQEYTIAYCGDNYLTCTKRTVVGSQSTSINLTLKFYFRSDVLIYTCPEISITRTGTTTPNDYYLSIIYDATNQVAAPDLINEINVLGSNVYYYNNFSLPSETQLSALYIWLQDNGNAQSSDPYGTGSTDNGGDPEGDRLQDHLTDSTLPTCGGLDLGFITLYRPTDTQLRAIAQFLWSDNVLDNFKKYFNNFADNIISLYSLPYTPSSLPTKTFVVGNMTSEITNVEYCSVRYFDIDMGQVEIKNKWGSYLDYSPYTKIEVYLPYLGLHSLDTDELMSPTRLDGSMPDTQGTVLSLVYRLDIMTGIIVAKIKVRVYNKNGSYTDQIRYQFSGRVGSNTPLTGQTFEAMVNAVVTAGAGLATTIATGGLTAPMSAAAAVTATVQAQKPSVERIGSISGDASMLATNVPYICITVPNKPLLDNQQKFTGFPSYKSGLLSDFSGYTEVIDAHVEGISCTEEERTKILQYLKEGVIL